MEDTRNYARNPAGWHGAPPFLTLDRSKFFGRGTAIQKIAIATIGAQTPCDAIASMC
jgi:hypothetical protein